METLPIIRISLIISLLASLNAIDTVILIGISSLRLISGDQ